MTAERRRDTPPLPDHIERIYLIGVCGTGMGSLAGMLQDSGYAIQGSDRGAYPPMSDLLANRGIEILQGWNGDNLRNLEPRPDLVVVGNVCRRDNPEVAAAAELGITCLSFPEVLRELFLTKRDTRIVITGTHGKTTTSSLTAWLLESAGANPGFMIGGVTGNFGTNFKLDPGPFVVEGDEYDSAYFDKVPKFWHYDPTVLVINNIEFDHADIYPDLAAIVGVFQTLVERLPADSVIWANLDDERVRSVVAHAPCAVFGFGISGDGDPGAAPRPGLVASNVELVAGGGARFDLHQIDETGERHELAHVTSPMPGMHNVRNVLAAFGAATGLGFAPEILCGALAGFRSVAKRQELVGEVAGVTVYDDFAHHPTAVELTVEAIAARHPGRRLWGIFEAKSNTSRRAVFQQAYVDALEGCDEVVLSAPWRQDQLPPEALIDLDRVVSDLNDRGTRARLVPEVADIVALVAEEAESGDVVLGMSGSSFGGFHRTLIEALSARDDG